MRRRRRVLVHLENLLVLLLATDTDVLGIDAGLEVTRNLRVVVLIHKGAEAAAVLGKSLLVTGGSQDGDGSRAELGGVGVVRLLEVEAETLSDRLEQLATELGDGVADFLGLLPPCRDHRAESGGDLLPDCIASHVSSELHARDTGRKRVLLTQVLLLALHLREQGKRTARLGVTTAGDDRCVLNESHAVVQREFGSVALARLRAELGETRGRVQSAVCRKRMSGSASEGRTWRWVPLTNSTGLGVQLVRRVGDILDLDGRLALRQNQLRMHLRLASLRVDDQQLQRDVPQSLVLLRLHDPGRLALPYLGSDDDEGNGMLTVASAVAKNRFWRTLRPFSVSSTVMSGKPVLLSQLSIILPTSWPDASEMPAIRSCVRALPYRCFLR